MMNFRNPSDKIGNLVVAFQNVEKNLVVTLGLILNDEDWEVPKIFASKLSFSNLCDVLDALVRVKYPDSSYIGTLEDIIKQASALEQQRNTFVHSFYDWTSFTPVGITYERTKHRVKRNKGFVSSSDQIDVDGDQIMDAITAAEEVDRMIDALNEDLFLEVASPEAIEDYYSTEQSS